MARAAKTMIDLLEACRRSKFLHFTLNQTAVCGLYLTPTGQMLANNLHAEWNQFGSSSSDTVPVFLGKSNLNLQENFANVQKQNKALKLPFGVMMEETGKNLLVPIGDTFILHLPETVQLCTTYLLPSSSANQFLYQLQRQRKIWWMRWSVDPGRYFISDVRHDEESISNTTSVSICAQFVDRTELELDHLELSLMPDDGERIVSEPLNAIVRVTNNLHRTTLAILMDALEGNAASEACVKIHRKIAPYKCAIIYQLENQCGQDEITMEQNLNDLSKHLEYVLRAAKLTVHDDDGVFGRMPHDHQIAELDQIGVPYVLLLNAKTLYTGLLRLRSRDTTLAETIHISDLPSYLVKLIHA
ncbi:DNA polymerase subunit gamma-2, mitochondrial-like [Anopheles maculipalpis]|uniref:DNA polymerase subunit gamma-2, mitochondrial-like n=1 Tax=Anopheles maculipalpis TaxID=1496333 RepID=UPI002159327D|nr:DNA polymerase subunit gamma-2, mitochondrial-like [Anopheles maculipalpis]